MPFWVLDFKVNDAGKLVPKAILIPGGKLLADKYVEEEGHPKAIVVELPTTNLDKATQMLKARRIDSLSDVKAGMQKFRRKD